MELVILILSIILGGCVGISFWGWYVITHLFKDLEVEDEW